MTNERQAILALVAMGRITALEAERLIRASQDAATQSAARLVARQWSLIALACLAAWVTVAHPHFNGLAALVHSALTHGSRALQSAISLGFKPTGGSV
jgi:hypothetical protein